MVLLLINKAQTWKREAAVSERSAKQSTSIFQDQQNTQTQNAITARYHLLSFSWEISPNFLDMRTEMKQQRI